MVEDPRFRRVAPRPERRHLPFEVGQRHGPLFAPAAGALLISVVAGCCVAAFLTWLFARWP